MSVAEPNGVAHEAAEVRWPELRQQISRRLAKRNLAVLWPECDADGSPLRWGVAVACGQVSTPVEALSRLAGGGKLARRFDVTAAAEQFLEASAQLSPGLDYFTEAVAWSYALPELAAAETPILAERLWWSLLGELQSFHRAASEQAAAESLERLIAAGEIGAVLAWRLGDLPSCDALRPAASEAIADWFDTGPYAVAAALSDGGRRSRLALAAALRSRRLAARLNRRIGANRNDILRQLTTWSTALMRGDGAASFEEQQRGQSTDGSGRGATSRGRAAGRAASEDLARGGLFATAAVEIGAPSLHTASEATLGRSKSHGRLAWKVDLPEPAISDETAKLAVMLPEWDVRRGRVAVDYSGATVRLEISGGKRPLIAGEWTAELRQNGQPVRATSQWSNVCWYSDDDVHYLELEQSFAGELKIQRQVLLLRDDESLFLADAVLGGPADNSLEVVSQLPLVPTAHVQEEHETRELTIVDGKPRAVVLPLSLNEWRMGPSPGTFAAVDADFSGDQPPEAVAGLRLESRLRGSVGLYSALWIDLDRKRIRSERTWRQLTVAESLRLVPRHEAAGFRIQTGDDQWLVYRSLTGHRNRTLLGKNLVSDFFCGRFDGSDGYVEELIAVDEQSN